MFTEVYYGLPVWAWLILILPMIIVIAMIIGNRLDHWFIHAFEYVTEKGWRRRDPQANIDAILSVERSLPGEIEGVEEKIKELQKELHELCERQRMLPSVKRGVYRRCYRALARRTSG